jgi:hypothetical protein
MHQRENGIGRKARQKQLRMDFIAVMERDFETNERSERFSRQIF